VASAPGLSVDHNEQPALAAGPGQNRRFRHIPALDGLRAVAVLCVMAYHAGVSWLPGGLLGVDVFFVLSGFLITSLLLSEKERSGRISLRSFWARRARRLLPAMVLLLCAVMAWATFLSPATSRASLRGDAFSTLGYVANWRFILSGQGYFDHFGPQSPLLHTWSVAVEEQFYLLWPLLLLLVIRWRRRGVFMLAFLGAGASGAAMFLLSLHGTNPDRLYYGTDTRALPLLLGCALASVRPSDGFSESISRMTSVAGARVSKTALHVLGLAGAAGLAYCWFRVADRSVWLYRGGFAVVAASAAALLLSCADAPRGPLARLLSLRPLRYIGAISYGLYLAHWPIFQYLTHARIHQSGAALLGIRFAATFVVAVLSYHLIEQPIRRGAFSVSWFRRRVPWLPRVVSRAFMPLTSLLVVGGLITGLTLTTRTTTQQLAAAGATPETAPSTQPPDPKPPALNSAQLAALNRPIRVLVEGDSLAETLAVGLGDEGKKYNYQSYNLGKLGCGVATGGPIRDARGEIAASASCDSWPTFRAADVRIYDPDVAVLLTGRWEVLDRMYDGQWMHVGEPTFDNYLASRLDQAINVLSAGGAKVLVLTTPCFAPQEQADGSIFPFDDPTRLARYNQLLRAAVARNPGKAVLEDLYGVLCPGNTYTSTVNGVLARMADGVHITEAGGQYVASELAQQIVALGSVRRAAQAKTIHANQAQAAGP
jgi:peptidoglycan/LPS O-acetylase OafA/YrhL